MKNCSLFNPNACTNSVRISSSFWTPPDPSNFILSESLLILLHRSTLKPVHAFQTMQASSSVFSKHSVPAFLVFWKPPPLSLSGWYWLLRTAPQPSIAETLLVSYFFIPSGKSADQDEVQRSHSFLTYTWVLTWQTLAQMHLVMMEEDRQHLIHFLYPFFNEVTQKTH